MHYPGLINQPGAPAVANHDEVPLQERIVLNFPFKKLKERRENK
jgi:hypothetical protein